MAMRGTRIHVHDWTRCNRPDLSLLHVVHPVNEHRDVTDGAYDTHFDVTYPLEIDRQTTCQLLEPWDICPVEPRVMEGRRRRDRVHVNAGLGTTATALEFLSALSVVAHVGIDSQYQCSAVMISLILGITLFGRTH
jgi:hypothetical protein